MTEKKLTKLEKIVGSCILIGGASFLGATFAAAADTLGSLAKYGFNIAENWNPAENYFAYIVGGILSGAFMAYCVFRREHIDSQPSSEFKPSESIGHSSGDFSSDDPGDDLMMSPFSATGSKYISTREYSGR
ncbi:hypothetical protein KY339_02750 [Candidatus Woesearchaeota archaeon]|nr:hypothetical protein [Candidatus Woesearchaeota archaeon]